ARPESTTTGEAATENTTLSSADRDLHEKTKPATDPTFPDEATHIGQFEYLLRYGALSRSIPTRSLRQFMDDLTEDLTAHPETYRVPIQNALRHDLERKRIARLFSQQALTRLWPLLLPVHHQEAAFCLDVLHIAATSCSTGDSEEQLRHTCVE